MKSKVIFQQLKNGVVLAALVATGTAQADMGVNDPRYDGDGALLQPEGFREWVFIGAPLTPNVLNGGSAAFPEFHHVYIEPGAYAEYKGTGRFPEGTVIAKELVLLQKGQYKDGSRNEPSGRGYFADGAHGFHGLDVMVKDSTRFKATNGWGFFNYNHSEPPYAASAKALPADKCASCHQAQATKDMVFTKFYPILNAR